MIQTLSSVPSSQVLNGVVVVLLLFPEGQVLLKELDDGLSIPEVILGEVINLLKRLLEGAVGKIACLLVVLHEFVNILLHVFKNEVQVVIDPDYFL